MMYTIDPVHALSRERPFTLTDAMEDPIQVAAAAGFADMSSSDPAFPKVSSYVYQVRERGMWGWIEV